MCGFAGVVFHQPPWGQTTFFKAAARLAHRGTTDARSWVGKKTWLQHYRLALQDEKGGAQPMVSPDGTWVLVFNGEIYNHMALRPLIERHCSWRFTTHSDSETLLAAWVAFGPACVQHLEGEFAFVVVRTDGKEVFGARDPFGVKPLFLRLPRVAPPLWDALAMAQPSYRFTVPWISFASEIKGLAGPLQWHREGLLRQMCGLYEPLRTPFQEVVALPGGAHMVARQGEEGEWEVGITLNTSPVRPLGVGAPTLSASGDAPALFWGALKGAVEDRLISDVPLGVYLSGGVDSRAIAFLMAQAHRQRGLPPPQAFTVGFQEASFDERQGARDAAQALGLPLTTLSLGAQDLEYAYTHGVYASENIQPYTNGAAKWWLSLMARTQVRGVLTGDGADELLGGYPSFAYTAWWRFALNAPGRRGGGSAHMRLKALPLGQHWRDGVYLQRFAQPGTNPWLWGLSAPGTGADFVDSLALWGVAHPLFGQIATTAGALMGHAEAQDWLGAQGPSVASWFALGAPPGLDTQDPQWALGLWQNYFCRTHLPVQVLNWVGDRMEMANTLEGRTPFLGRAVAQAVAQLPNSALVAGLLDKSILRLALHRFSPPAVAAGALVPKRQFGAPLMAHILPKDSILEAAGAVGLDPSLLENHLFGPLEGMGGEPLSPFGRTHLLATLQTLTSLALVNTHVVGQNPPPRDGAREQQVLAASTP